MNSDINIAQVTEYLSRTFSYVRSKNYDLGRDNSRGTVLHKYEVEFCYLLDEIKRGPIYIAPKRIQEANNLIEDMRAERKS